MKSPHPEPAPELPNQNPHTDPVADHAPDLGRTTEVQSIYRAPVPPGRQLPDDSELPPDFRTPLRAWDLFLLAVFYILCGVVLTTLVAAGAFLLFGISFNALSQSNEAKAVIAIVSQALLSAATVFFLYVLVRVRTGAPFWRTVGWRGFPADTPRGIAALKYVFGGFVMAVCVAWASRLSGNESALPMEQLFRSRASVLLLMGLGILVAPLVEETVFRGCIYPVIARRFGLPAGVIATGTLFGLAHAQQLWGGWWQIGLLVFVGIILTYVRARSRTVAASYLVHLGYNTILFAGFYVATGGLRSLSA